MKPIPDNWRDLPALSIRQPWAWFLVRPDLVDAEARRAALACGEIKDVENRVWGPRMPGRPQNFRGEFLIHTAKGYEPEEHEAGLDIARHLGLAAFPAYQAMQRGGIVGIARVVDWVHASRSRWFSGPGALVIEDARPLPFTACGGALGFFRPKFTAKEAELPL